MLISVLLDPVDPGDIRLAAEFLEELAERRRPAGERLRALIEEVLALNCGELLVEAFHRFRGRRFDIVCLADAISSDRAPEDVVSVRTLHSHRANLGRAAAQRGIELFQKHGGQPLRMSIRPNVADILDECLAVTN